MVLVRPINLILGNSINYNSLTGKQDEFSTTPFYSDGLQYGIMQQAIESGNTEGGVASETGLVPSVGTFDFCNRIDCTTEFFIQCLVSCSKWSTVDWNHISSQFNERYVN